MKRSARWILYGGLAAFLAVAGLLIFSNQPSGPRVGLHAEVAPQPEPASGALPTAGREATESSDLQTLRSLGKAYYEQGKYDQASEAFRKVTASRQARATDHLDLGLALLQSNKLNDALGELTTARQMDPKLLAADYNLGILYKHELRFPEAAAALKRVSEADPRDPAAWFNLGSVYFAERDFAQALDAYQHVIRMGFVRGQNFYVASLFRGFTTLLRLQRQAEAQKLLKIHERVRDKVPSLSLQNLALEAGKYGAVLVPPSPLTPLSAPAARISFADVTRRMGIDSRLRGNSVAAGAALAYSGQEIRSREYSLDYARKHLIERFGPSIAIGDYDGDGHPDLYVVVPGGKNHLFRNRGDGTFTDVTEKAGVEGTGGDLSAAFADYNNSGHPSLFVAGVGGVTLYRNRGDGTFVDETARAGLRGAVGELATRVVAFDADNDGFLDLIATAYTDLAHPPAKELFSFPQDFAGARSHFYRNQGDGTFQDETVSSGLAGAAGRMRGAVFADFTNSGWDDLVFFRDDGPPLVYLNEGGDKFRARSLEAGPAFHAPAVFDAQVADFNHDGNFDLALWTPSGPQVLLNRGEGRFRVRQLTDSPIAAPSDPFAFRGTVADLNGDSFDDLLAVDAAGKLHCLENQAGRFAEVPARFPSETMDSLSWLAPAWLTEPGKLDLVAVTRSGRFAAFEQESPLARWMEVNLKGFKSNTAGTGTVVEFKRGNFYKKVLATGGPVGTYAGDLDRLDVVRVTWPNQVVQNSTEVTTDKPLLVQESQRLASSCPLLYVWNGRRYVFLTDVLGTSPLGELAPDGSFVQPHPEEYIRLPENLPTKDGAYTFKLTDELREVDFFDQLRLVAVDHPPSESIYANEIYSSSPSAPALYAVKRKQFPRSAVDGQGRNVLPLILKADGRYAGGFRQDRILGMAQLHTLTLDLGDVARSKPLALWLKGWVFWTDSNGARALMGNSKLRMVSPYLQVRDRQGRWVTVIPDMGLPSGTNRTMRVDLTGKFLSADRHVRIVTNLCVYWDQIFFTTDERPVRPGVELPLVSADLHYRGFSVPISDPQHHRPDYFQYTKLLKQVPWNPMAGLYTRYGDVQPLLSRVDDQLVIMATGDEMTVRFGLCQSVPPNPAWKRSLFLYAAGYAKDGEPNTAFSRTVAPLPYGSMPSYPYSPSVSYPDDRAHQQYRRSYLTRPGYLLIPPLAPPAPAERAGDLGQSERREAFRRRAVSGQRSAVRSKSFATVR